MDKIKPLEVRVFNPTKRYVYLSTISQLIEMFDDEDLLEVVLLVANKSKNIKPNTVERTRNRI